MAAKLKKRETAAADAPFIPRVTPAESPMIAEHAHRGDALEQHDPSGRRLRNRLIVANVIAWIAIIAVVRLVFF
jgi:hypothetical protein